MREAAAFASPLTRLLPLLALVLAACGHPALREAEELRRGNQLPQAWTVLDQAARQNPGDKELRLAQARVREQLVNQLLMQIEGLRAARRWEAALQLVARLREVDPKQPRLEGLEQELARGQRYEVLLQQGQARLREGRLEQAEQLARQILIETPSHPGAKLLMSQVAQSRPLEGVGSELGPAFQKPVTLEFREAPLRQVFEALARSSGINFVFDKDVRADAKVTVFLRNVTLDEAMRIVLTTQQLDRKLLNESSVLVFPNNAAKQREHQELVTRTLYLTNAEAKQVQALLRTIAKVRDIHIDERLNLLVVRDTPEVMRLVEKLIASVDLPEPEVMLEVEVMELASDRLDSMGLQWPETVQFGLPGVAAGSQVLLNQRDNFRGSIVNPALLATVKGTAGNTNLLANPKIRVRNRDKALVHIGEKLPVFTTTSTANVGVSASVQMLDIGLKVEVEPTVQLDGDVTIKVGLEVSNLIGQVPGPSGSVAYQTGTRRINTSLRLADGETQILAGLINDEDRRKSNGVPGLASLPLLGKLFGLQTDTRNKTEIVLLITPRILRNLSLPDAAQAQLPSGTDALPGAFSTLLRPQAKAAVGMSNASGSAGAAPRQAAEAQEARVQLDVTPQVAVGGTVSVALKNDSGLAVRGEIEFDPARLQPAVGNASGTPGRIPFEMVPRGGHVLLLRPQPGTAGQVLNVSVVNLTASGVNGENATVRLEGSGMVAVEASK
ncbi:secretin N-terminal domain-containing protein [Pelomonas sp. SE-A7]|uniref:secretin N-terminal domain-containing protein n=1 Tax=Pelomonas sp. SE-A7 TaxID=3054953 RepID=UPI00259D0BDF|nr:secretin N-terminal domain-containing protein [Pelomonas sp. SE-A7]MDM4767018.1 secretin N-terminal domain-containing protein [Pelomonas sp. SE-A7]